MSAVSLPDLPEDILVLIFPLLSVPDFLSICSVNKHFRDNFLKSPEFWRDETSRTFRIPIHPLLRADGPRWYWLYKHLRTKTKVYSWGKSPLIKAGTPGQMTWPTPAIIPDGIGTIADLQCGGWSTSILTSNGIIYTFGMMNGMRRNVTSKPGDPPLGFPLSFRATTKDQYEPATAIKHFSSGRCHILGLSDDGTIWIWDDNSQPASKVVFSNVHTISARQDSSVPGTVTSVFAGWSYSSVFVVGVGIVFWPLRPHHGRNPDELLIDAEIVPETGLRRSDLPRDSDDKNFRGEVRNYVVLENYIVFITDSDRIFATHLRNDGIVELSEFFAPDRRLQDIQGAFRKFAVFTSDGEVLLGTARLVDQYFPSQDPGDPAEGSLSPDKPPGLQNNGVISIAFGDHHFAALHANGKVSSHGVEPQGNGAFGLGGLMEGIPFRSITRSGRNYRSDVIRFDFAKDTSSYVWYEPEKAKWLLYLRNKAREAKGTGDRPWSLALEENERGLLEKYSPCIERQGNSWDDFEDIRQQDPDGLGAYFTLNVAAAGWHTDALVLVNEGLAQKVRDKHILDHGDGVERIITGAPALDAREIAKPGRPVKYRWETQKFPPLYRDANENILFDRYDFDSWKYGMPVTPEGERNE